MYDLFSKLMDLVWWYFFRAFASLGMSKTRLQVLSYCINFAWFWHRGSTGLTEYFLSCYSLEEFVEDWDNMFFECLLELTRKILQAWYFLCGFWIVYYLINCYDISHFYFFLNTLSYNFCRNLPFSAFKFIAIKLLIVFSYHFNFCWVCSYILSNIPNIVYVWELPFFPNQPHHRFKY